MSGDFRFAPDESRAAKLDASIRAGLTDSLKTIFESLDADDAVDPARAHALFGRIAQGPAPPAMFAAYVDLVLSLFQETTGAKALIQELLGYWPAPMEGIRFVTLDDADLGPGRAERYRRLINEEIVFGIAACSQAAKRDAQGVLTAALDLLRAGAGDAYLELTCLIREIVLVADGAAPGQSTFEGASTFSLWGALALNVAGLQDRVSAAVALAHEAAHALLFGFTGGGRLTRNDDDERFASPLRRDPRPMEGVAHATFVSARMHYVSRALLDSGLLGNSEADQARTRAGLAFGAYEDGVATVLTHGRLTPAGQAVFAELRRFMDRQAQLAS